jgi:hypothetical protein
MKKLILSITALLAFCLQTQAAITVTARGTGGNNSAATSLTITPGSNLAKDSMGVLVVALDNAGSAGASAIAPATATDSVNNVWTLRVNPLFDNGAASAGVELAFYTAPLNTAFTTTNNLVISWAGSTSVTAKAWALWEVIPTNGTKQIQYVTGASGTGSTTGTPTITTSSITSGDVVIGGGGAESASTWTGDADTSNGSWSSQQATGFGTGTSGMSVTSQSKVTTGTGTQTYNPTLTSVDTILGWIQLTEVTRPASGFFHYVMG